MSEISTATGPETIISATTRIRGEITAAGPLAISGQVEGEVHGADVIEVTEEASIEGNIHGSVVVIDGAVRGNVSASKTCRLSPTARLSGELRAASLAISEGASFVGKVFVGAGALEEASEQPTSPVAHVGPQTVEQPVAAVSEPVREVVREAVHAVAAHVAHEAQPAIRVMPEAVQATATRTSRIIKAAH